MRDLVCVCEHVYHVAGVLEFGGFDIQHLSYGDQIIDNHGAGRTAYVHQCCICDDRFLRNMLAYVPLTCSKTSCVDHADSERSIEYGFV